MTSVSQRKSEGSRNYCFVFRHVFVAISSSFSSNFENFTFYEGFHRVCSYVSTFPAVQLLFISYFGVGAVVVFLLRRFAHSFGLFDPKSLNAC